MKKIFKFTLIVSLCAALVSLTGCTNKELDVDPLGDAFAFAGMAPNPVMRGGVLNIYGRGLDNVKEVCFAGENISVTEFVKLSKGTKLDTLQVKVPLEGPEVGKVSIVAQDGRTLSSFADLTFSEPIEIESFTPAAVLSGDVITFKGEYLNVVKEVIFTGENAVAVEFESQSRHELKVKVPANVLTGPIILSDVNEVEDQTSIPNHIYTSTDLTVGDPTVVKAAKTIYKSGDVIKVDGAHLDMIKRVDLPQASDVKFVTGAEADWITFNLPPSATDGNITLISFAGKEFNAGEIETVTVTDLGVKSLAEDERFKAGCEVEISGEDLDLVTKVEFTGAEASWYLDGEVIVATLPAKAKDGAVTVTLDNGKQVISEDIEVVKAIVTGLENTEAVAGTGEVVVLGTDLDLVSSVKIGTKVNTFIDCEFEYTEEDKLVVTLSPDAYTGILTLTSANGYETYTDEVTVTYENAIDLVFEANPIELGSNVAFTGEGLGTIESIVIKKAKVMNYVERSAGRVEFVFPEELGPGVYRMEITLIDGTTLTWPVPLTVTASYEKKILWSGETEITWSDGGRVIIPAEEFEGIPAGTLMYICYTQKDQVWAQAQFNYGDWTGINFDEGEITFNQTLVPTDIYGWFSDGVLERVTPVVLTADILANIQAKQGTDGGQEGWGVIIQGSDLIFTEIYCNVPADGEKTIWEGEVDITWSDGGRVIIPAEAFNGAKAGKMMAIYYTQKDQVWGQAQFNYGDWTGINFNGDEGVQFNQTLVPTDVYGWFSDGVLERCTEVQLTSEILANIQAKQGTDDGQEGWGVIIQGSDLIFTKITLK